ncbi:MAG: hypothetical protein AAFQ19_15060 [Pseudomonadota bacterium]
MSALAALALMATHWTCTSPLSLGPDADILTPVSFELTLAPDGRLHAVGVERIGRRAFDFRWSGRWTAHERQVVMIGAKTYPDAARAQAELRGVSQRVEQDVLVLNLTEAGPWMTLIRCLPQREVA